MGLTFFEDKGSHTERDAAAWHYAHFEEPPERPSPQEYMDQERGRDELGDEFYEDYEGEQ